MKLRKFLCLFLLVAVVLTLASCKFIGGTKYTVKFDSNGGSPVADQTVRGGKTLEKPEDPKKDGYVFIGWYKGDNEWDFSSAVNSDMTLVAEWEKDASLCNHEDNDENGMCDLCAHKIAFTISYYDGTRDLVLSPKSYTLGQTGLSLPTPRGQSHYEFVGWYLDSDFTQPATGIDTSKGEDLAFYAKFEPIAYTLKYELNGGTNSPENPSSYTAKELPITLAEPTREGYTFLGWYTDNSFTSPITEINRQNVGNLTLYARWANPAEAFTVTYLDHEGNVVLVDDFYKSDSDQPIRAYNDPAFEGRLIVDGYFFIAWVDASDESITYTCIPAGNSDNLTVKATFKNEATHNVLYCYNTGECFATDSFLEVDGFTGFYYPTKAGFVFDGWYEDMACTVKITSIPANTKEDVLVFGKFIPNTYNITLTIDGQGVDFKLDGVDVNKYQTSDTAIALPEIPAKEGYVILGWYTSDGKLMEENKIAAGFYGDLELTARYSKISYKITYYLAGGSNDSRNVDEYLHDEIPTLYDADSKTGYKFAGWYTDASFSGTAISDLSAYANQDISLFALWIPDINNDSSILTPEVPF